MPYPRGVSDPEQVEGAMPYDSEDGFPRFFQQGIRSGRQPLHGPVSHTCVKGVSGGSLVHFRERDRIQGVCGYPQV
jgi:hypothetical protein